MQGSSALQIVFGGHFIVCPVKTTVISSQSQEPDITGVRRMLVAKSVLQARKVTYICLPPKIKRCCTGGIPSFSSTRSFMRETYGHRTPSQLARVYKYRRGRTVLIRLLAKAPCSPYNLVLCQAQSPCQSGCGLYFGSAGAAQR